MTDTSGLDALKAGPVRQNRRAGDNWSGAARYLIELTARAADPTDVQATLDDLAEFATHGIPGCNAVGITLMHDDRGSTVAAAGQQARDIDNAQYRHGDGPCLTAIRTGTVISVEDFTVEHRWPPVAEVAQQVGVRSALSLPLHDGQRVVGGLNLYGDKVIAFSQEAHQVAALVARHAGFTLRYLELLVAERAERAAEHRIAETLQRSLLPSIPDLPGVVCAARYQPSAQAAQVGGDWYDAFPLPNGAIGIAIGDVMGHDLNAAASMGQLRSVLRSYAWEGSSPAAVMDRMDRLVQGFDMAQFATAIYARLVVDPAGAMMMFSNAGHLPPLLRRPDGTVTQLTGGASRVIGAPLAGAPARSEGAVALPPGSTLLLYTDGLVENRHREFTDGIDQLTAFLSTLPVDLGPEELCDQVITVMLGPAQDDDVALLAIHLPAGSHRQP